MEGEFEVMGNESSGYVYFLLNESLPGLVKIGHTHRTVSERIFASASPEGVTPDQIPRRNWESGSG